MELRSKMVAPPRRSDKKPVSSPPSDESCGRRRNIFNLLARREISPRMNQFPKRRLGEQPVNKAGSSSSGSRNEIARNPKRDLLSWVEAESLRHLSAKYCPLTPPPRSTIAAAFSPDGRTIASTHGDHTVKIIDCQTGNCLKVLDGHRRTPWVVRFHPSCPEILASGSLDHEVRLWNLNTKSCIEICDFYRPIASISFHAKGEVLAVASGHKLYIWNYIEKTAPVIVLKTRRSLRAVHFHPHAVPLILTAEVNDLESPDSSMTQATSLGYLQYPPPAVIVANFHSADRISFFTDLVYSPFSLPSLDLNSLGIRIDRQDMVPYVCPDRTHVGSSAPTRVRPDVNIAQHHRMVSHRDASLSVPRSSHSGIGRTLDTSFPSNPVRLNALETDDVRLNNLIVSGEDDQESGQNQTESGQLHSSFPSGDGPHFELPYLQGQSQVGLSTIPAMNGGNHEHSAEFMSFNSHLETHNVDTTISSLAMPGSTSIPVGFERYIVRSRFGNLLTRAEPKNVPPPVSLFDSDNSQPIINRVQSELANSLGAMPAAELPCTVKLRVWSHDTTNPSAPLTPDRCRLTIPHAVLCSEMGAHFSPCGRFLATCVACSYPHMDSDPGFPSVVYQESGLATSPTRHPISANLVMYELRVYSLEESSFGSILVSRAIRAAHCLTSIQFSPTSEHVLLAYGRRHGSLLKSVVVDGETTLPIYTVLEVYKVADLELVRVLSSAEDEVNVACFHPFAGGGLVYGTKEGKLRVLQYEGAYGEHSSRPH